MILRSHLESGDSVRTNPKSKHCQHHSNRFFAEAFSRLLFGEQLRSGHIPMFDSYGAVDFYSRLARALLKSPKRTFVGNPFVLTHFSGMKKDHLWGHDQTETIFLSAFAYRVGDPDLARKRGEHFILSALSDIEQDWEIRRELALHLEQAANSGPTDSIRKKIDALGMSNQSQLHLDNVFALDDYFRRNLVGTVQAVEKAKEYKIPEALRAAFQPDLCPRVEGLESVLRLLRELEDRNVANRSMAYKIIHEEQKEAYDEPLAKEFVDSVYMWQQSRLAGARTEITSSQIESDDGCLRGLGEVINGWVDETKKRLEPSLAHDDAIRPMLHCSNYYSGQDSLSNPEFRDALCQALVEHFQSAQEQHDRNAVNSNLATQIGRKRDQRQVLAYWQEAVQSVNQSPFLGKLIRVSVSEKCTLTCAFKWNDEIRHEVASRAELAESAAGEAEEEICENFEQGDWNSSAIRTCNELTGGVQTTGGPHKSA